MVRPEQAVEIKRITDKFFNLWMRYPDYRHCELIEHLARQSSYKTRFVTDKEFEELIDHALNFGLRDK